MAPGEMGALMAYYGHIRFDPYRRHDGPYSEQAIRTLTYSTLVECSLVSDPPKQFNVGPLCLLSDLQYTESKLLYFRNTAQ